MGRAETLRRSTARSTAAAISKVVKRPGTAARSYTRSSGGGVRRSPTADAVDSQRLNVFGAPSRIAGGGGEQRTNPFGQPGRLAPQTDPRLGWTLAKPALAFASALSPIPGFDPLEPLDAMANPKPYASPRVPGGNNMGMRSSPQDELPAWYGGYQDAAAQHNDHSEYDSYMEQLQANLEAWMEARDEAIRNGQIDVAAQYDDVIQGLQDDLAGAAQAKADSNAAFARYRATVDPHLQGSVDAAAATDNADIEAMQGAEAVTAQFNSGVAELDEVLAKIAPGNADLAAALESEVRDFQVMAEDALRDDMSNVLGVANASREFAIATANYLQQQDVTMTDIERQKVEISIQKQMDALQESIAEAEKQKAAAMDEARQKIMSDWGDAPWMDDPEQAWQYVFDSWSAKRGLDFETAGQINEMLGELRSAGITDRKSAEGYLRNHVMETNLSILEDGLGMSLEKFLDAGNNPYADAALQAIFAWASSPSPQLDFGGTTFPGATAKAIAAIGATIAGLDADELATFNDYRVVLDANDLYRDHVDQWNSWQRDQRAYNDAVRRGGQAPNNYQNRNQPAYAYRREVVAPYYADQIRKRFKNAEIGGLGYIRPPSQEGGGKAVNSDHQSGGAIDVYNRTGDPAMTDYYLKQIAAWAMTQPGVSFVTYEGNKAHQTGTDDAHVHISFQLGWQVS